MPVKLTIQLTPAVVLANRVQDRTGSAKFINLSALSVRRRRASPASRAASCQGDERERQDLRSRAACRHCHVHGGRESESVAISAYGANDPNKVLATAG